jgi:hypothetical protein
MAAAFLTSHTLGLAAKRRLAVSSVASVGSGYERSLRPCKARFSRAVGATRLEGDR